MIIDSNSRRPEIEYPCKWGYKVIGSNVNDMIAAIEECAGSLEYEITPSNISRNEKYFSLNCYVIVPSEAARDMVYQKLSSHRHVKLVL